VFSNRLARTEDLPHSAGSADAPFNPLDTPLPDLTSPPEKRGIGGLGVHLVKFLIDDASYAREGAVNIMVLIKHVGSTV
jgi:serine/threonine-protein kinase RsbW